MTRVTSLALYTIICYYYYWEETTENEDKKNGSEKSYVEFSELGPEFRWSQTVFIESVVPSDSLEHLDVSAAEPVTAIVYQL